MSEMFLEMRKAALKRLSHRNPREIAQLSGGMYCPDRNEMKITSLGKTVNSAHTATLARTFSHSVTGY